MIALSFLGNQFSFPASDPEAPVYQHAFSFLFSANSLVNPLRLVTILFLGIDVTLYFLSFSTSQHFSLSCVAVLTPLRHGSVKGSLPRAPSHAHRL